MIKSSWYYLDTLQERPSRVRNHPEERSLGGIGKYFQGVRSYIQRCCDVVQPFRSRRLGSHFGVNESPNYESRGGLMKRDRVSLLFHWLWSITGRIDVAAVFTPREAGTDTIKEASGRPSDRRAWCKTKLVH